MFKKTPLLFRCLLALSVAFVPMLPAFASSKASTGEHAAHAGSHVSAKVSGDPVKPLSGKHDHCNGHCCLACGMSGVDASVFWNDVDYARPVQIPTVASLHPHPLVTTPHRPPRTLS